MVTGPGDEALLVEAVMLRVVLLGIGVGVTVLAITATVRSLSLLSALPTIVIAATTVGVALTQDGRALRGLEVALFASAAALLVGVAVDADNAAAAWQESALWSAVLVFAYGALVPNPRWRAIIGIAVLAMPPVLLLATWSAREPAAYRVVVSGGVASTLIILAVAALVAMAANALMTALLDLTVRTREADMYRLVDKIGAGGMGEIWRAQHRRLSRTAAIKLIRPDLLGNDRESVAATICRFELEAKSTAQLRSPNTVEVYDFGTTQNGTFYYVMEYLDGLDLAQLVDQFGPLPAARAIYLLEQVCQSLGDAHDNRLIHRDVKPANIFASRMGTAYDHVKVLDFGLARPIEQTDVGGISEPDRVLGTPGYMAPELVTDSGQVDARVDVYAVGCVGYFLLTGDMVFDAENAMAMAIAHATEEPSSPTQSTDNPVPADLETIVMRCLAKRPDDRYADCHELARALRGCAAHGEWTSEHARAWWQSQGSEASNSATSEAAATTLLAFA